MGNLLDRLIENKTWYPQSITTYENAIKFDNSYGRRSLKKNFAYNMQYVEYLDKQLEEFTLSSVLYTMTCKSYVVSTSSVIELILYVLLKNNNLISKSEWEEVIELHSNEKRHKNKKYKVVAKLYHKVDEYEETMLFEALIKKVRSNKLLPIEKSLYKSIDKLRKLRNKIHIQSGASTTDHDYNNFSYDDVVACRSILYKVLTCDELCKNKAVFSFLLN